MGLAGSTLQIIDVSHTRATQARVAVPGAVLGREEIAPYTGVIQAQGRIDVRNALTRRARNLWNSVVVIHTMAPFMVKYASDFACVTATARRLEKVHSSVPVSVAGIVDVHIGHQLLLQP